jgi:hypothetical protein
MMIPSHMITFAWSLMPAPGESCVFRPPRPFRLFRLFRLFLALMMMRLFP